MKVKVKVVATKQLWQSPDGNRTIYEVEMEYNGQRFKAKTYSAAIASVGFEGDVESYKKQGKQGEETFIKQQPKEGFTQGGQQAQSGRGYSGNTKDEAAIKAMWAIDKAKDMVLATLGDNPKDAAMLLAIEVNAQELFAMVDRIKVGIPAPEVPAAPANPDVVYEPVEGEPITLDDLPEGF